MLATASLNQPARRPNGGEALQSAVRGGVQDGGAKLQAGRKAEAEAKHAARLASTGTGARAAAMAALRASRRKAAARLPAAHTAGAHDSASQTAAHRMRDGISQTGADVAGSLRLPHPQFGPQPVIWPPSAADSMKSGTLHPDAPRQGAASDGDGVMSTAPGTAAMQHVDQHGSASDRASLAPLSLPSPPRPGRRPPPASPPARGDLALQMGLPPSPQLPARHPISVPQFGREMRSGDNTLLPYPSATAALAVAAAVAVLPRPSQPLAWMPLASSTVAGSTGSVLPPIADKAVASALEPASALPAVSDSTGDSPQIESGTASYQFHHSAGAQTAVAPGVGGNWSMAAPAHEGLSRDPAASHNRAAQMAPRPGHGMQRTGCRPDLVSDIEALRDRWAAACDPYHARQTLGQHRGGALDAAHPRRPLSRLFGRLHSGDPALAASPASWLHGRGGGVGAACSPLCVLPPPPGVRHKWDGTLRGPDLYSSYPGRSWLPSCMRLGLCMSRTSSWTAPLCALEFRTPACLCSMVVTG